MAYNSTIRQKKCSCGKITGGKPCAKWPTRGCKGKNYNCLTPEEKQAIGTRNKLNQRNRNNKNYLSRKVHKSAKELDPTENDLKAWFLIKMHNSNKVCENCGKWLGGLNSTDWRGSQHHIIEKHLCPSVKTELANHAVLGRWCCHPIAHTNYMTVVKMPIFPELKRRFELFKDKIIESERRFIPDCFTS